MRFLLPENPWIEDSFAENVAITLIGMGHDVVMPKKERSYSHLVQKARSYKTIIEKKLRPNRYTKVDRYVLRAVRGTRIDCIISPTCEIHPDVLLDAKRKYGVKKCIAWWGDPACNIKYMSLFSDAWDTIYLKERLAVQRFKALGLDARFLHECMNPLWHKPVSNCANENLVVAGNYYNYRMKLIHILARRGVSLSLFGSVPPTFSTDLIKSLHKGEYIVKLRKSEVFGESLACLNSTSLSEFDSLNCRAFEICGAGGLQLIENRLIVSECFEPGKELILYNSAEEIPEIIERAKRDVKWAAGIRANGAKRALADHTYKHRLEKIIADF